MRRSGLEGWNGRCDVVSGHRPAEGLICNWTLVHVGVLIVPLPCLGSICTLLLAVGSLTRNSKRDDSETASSYDAHVQVDDPC